MQNEIASEITKLEILGLNARPVILQGIAQKSLKHLLTTHDIIIRSNKIRVPAGTVLCLTSFGQSTVSHGLSNGGKITSDLRVKCLDGITRILPSGSPVEVVCK